MKNFWSYDEETVLTKLKTSKDGLTMKEARKRINEYGHNVFEEKKKVSNFVIFLNQFKNPITLILIFAAILSIILKSYSDGIIILVIIFISSLLSYRHESKARSAVDKLLTKVSVTSCVLRNGKFAERENSSLTKGDIISVNTGDMIPADCLLLESNSLMVDESSLTGEIFPVEKTPGKLPAKTSLSKRNNALWMGTYILSGSGKAVIVNLAKESEFGKINDSLDDVDTETDFEKGIKEFGNLIMKVTVILIAFIFILNVALQKSVLESFMFALVLSVGLTPQMLPAIISVNLSQGAKRMSEEGVIVKKLNSIENFGAVTVMCSDKTGTITKGKLKLEAALDEAGRESESLRLMAAINAHFQEGYVNPIDKSILESKKYDFSSYDKVLEIPYTFDNKILSIIVKDKKHNNIMITKGALSSVIDTVTKYEDNKEIKDIKEVKKQIMTLFDKYSSEGYRVLGLAYKVLDQKESYEGEIAEDMIFKGFLLFKDPLKDDVKDVIKKMKDLGVSLKMITGDNELIARNVGTQIGLDPNKVLTGDKLNYYSLSQLNKKIKDIDIFAEISPNQKEKIILAYKQAGEVVGYMGDGINDAPAIKQADVGISVNDAADTAKDAASIVLLQNSLKVLESGIEEGRRTFINTLKYIFVATSANFGNMFSMAGASIFLKFLPLLPKQVLLTNLFTDFPSLQIASDSVDEKWQEKPVKWDMKFIKKFMIIFGVTSSVFDFLTFFVLLKIFKAGESLFQTGWMLESVISAMLVMLIVRTARPLLKSKPSPKLVGAIIGVAAMLLLIIYSPLNSYLGLTILPLKLVLTLLGISVIYAITTELLKKYFYKYNSFSRKD